jgi:hypothetical protein
MGFGLGIRIVKRLSLLLPIVFLAVVSAAAQGGNDDSALSTISNTGHAVVSVDRAMKPALDGAGVDTPITVMAVRDQKQFVRFASKDRGLCFGVRNPDAAHFAFTCWNDFPSRAHPILDESAFGAETGEPLHILGLQGFAADGVAAIDLTDAAGVMLTRVPVTGNVYNLQAPPPSTVRLVAVDAAGKTLFSVPR